ncbi:MAG: 4-alpha-glucanotransferase [Candidatus Omnitrophica bacterium]|nr:4-alpha-glucanotransferase [Candidatus Omnitrophota bacterium]
MHLFKSDLDRLAESCGVLTAYRDAFGRVKRADEEALLAVLCALGAPLGRAAQAGDVLRARAEALWRRALEPVHIVWDGGDMDFNVRLPEALLKHEASCELHFEEGGFKRWTVPLSGAASRGRKVVEGVAFVVKGLRLKEKLPLGYHKLRVELGGASFTSLVISAPRRAWAPHTQNSKRMWGAFLPLYSLRTGESWGSGDFSDLRRLIGWVGELGGNFAATLPIFAAFLDEPFEPSPYSPVSRLFWNEFYLDVKQVPELLTSPRAQTLVRSQDFQNELGVLGRSGEVDYRGGMALKRRVLSELAQSFFEDKPRERFEAFRSFLSARPEVEEYARFRAVCEKTLKPWTAWPERLKHGAPEEADYHDAHFQYHCYVQWLAEEALGACSRHGQRSGLALDLPLGVHPQGYDVWKRQDLFAGDMCVGAPPDPVFMKGQDWSFPPIHPGAQRSAGYDYFRASFRALLRFAGLVRIDHVMGFHRLFWIPKGMDARRGVYVRYPHEELYAVLSLESHRAGSIIVGENLGTVPPEVNRSMAGHGILKMFVVQYEIPTNKFRFLRNVPADVAASLNTHDMPPFAASWRGLDVEDRLKSGVLTPDGARREWREREGLRRILVWTLRKAGWLKNSRGDEAEILNAVLNYLGSSRAAVMQINLEDLWMETHPQNVPGTGLERPNWRRRARFTFEEFSGQKSTRDILARIHELRNL